MAWSSRRVTRARKATDGPPGSDRPACASPRPPAGSDRRRSMPKATYLHSYVVEQFGVRGRRRQADGHFGSAVGVVVDRRGAVIAAGEGVDDGQAESGAASGAGGVGAGESLEGPRQEDGVKPRAVVMDTHLDGAGVGGLGVDGDWRCAVFGCVVDEVSDDSVEVVGVGANPRWAWAVDDELVAEDGAVTVGDSVDVFFQLDGWWLGRAAGVGDG